MTSLRDFSAVDPDHVPIALELIAAISNTDHTAVQVACFDTAFHRSMPRVARMYAVPPEPHDERLTRYGFHGLSCEGLDCFGLKLDAHRNAEQASIISGDDMPVVVRVMKTDEDLMIARHTRRLFGAAGGDHVPI